MNRFLTCILLAVLFCNSTSAQVRVTNRKLSRAEIARLNAQFAKDSLKGTFEHLELDGNDFRGRIEHFIIRQGDSTRIKYVLDRRKIVKIAIDGGGETSQEDIRKGVFITKISPKKTTWVAGIVEYKSYSSEIYKQRVGYRVIVVEPEKYDSIMTVFNALPQGKQQSVFLDKLAGGTWKDFSSGKIK